jgi:hypothetical protein
MRDQNQLTVLIMGTMEETKEYIGMWVTADGHIRHELLLTTDTMKHEEIVKALIKVVSG